MTFNLTCKHCRIVISADTEDDLVIQVQQHARGHDRPQELTREHILSRVSRQQPASGLGTNLRTNRAA
jgi:hypothetical protein